MTVKVAVSAEADEVLRSLDKIREAIKRSGQEALTFSKIDLSHPELRFVAADLKTVQERLDTLHKVSRGDTAAAFRSTLGAAGMSSGDFLSRHRDWLEHVNQRYPDQADRNRHITNFGRVAFGGTQFAPAPPVAPPGAPPGGGGGGGGGVFGDIGGSAMGMAKAAGMFMMVQAGITKVADMASRAVDQAESEAMANDTLMRHIRDASVDFNQLRDAVRETATGLRLTDDQMQRLSLSWVKATNSRDVGETLDNVNTAGGFARGYGMDPAAAVGAFGKAAYLGEDPKKFAMLIASAVQEGHQTGQADQVMQSLLHWSETASKLIVTGGNLEGYAAMYSGLNATGQPGLKGQAAESLIGQIDSAVRQGGAAGDASMALTYRALARRGISDPYEVQYMLDGGAFQKVGDSTMFDVMRGEVKAAYGGMPKYQRWNAMSRMFGINSRQAEALEKFHPGDIGKATDTLAQYNLDFNKVDYSGMSDIAEVMGSKNMIPMRDKLLKRQDITDDEKKALGEASGDSLKELMIRTLAEHGQEKTVATRLQQAEADLANALTKAGGGLIGVIADMKGATAGLVDGVGELSKVLGDWYETIHPKKVTSDDYNPDGTPAGGVDEWGNPLGKDGRNIAGMPLPGPRADGRGLSTGGTAGPVGVTATGASMTVEERALLDSLSGGESKGDYNARNPAGAYGRYQFIEKTRLGLLKQMKLPTDTPLTDELQDRMALRLAKQAGWHSGMSPAETAAVLKGVWVSLPGGSEENTSLDTFTRRFQNATAAELSRDLKSGTTGTSTPLPADDPGKTKLQAPGHGTISPLRVIHEREDGTLMGEEYLPVRMIPTPSAAVYGVPR